MNADSLIWTRSQCAEAFDELLIKIAMSSFAELEGRELLKENERLKEEPEFQLPPGHEKMIRSAIKKHERKENFVLVRKAASKIITKVAVVFLILAIGFSTTMTVSAEFRRVIYNLLLTTTERYTQIEIAREYTEFVDSDVYIRPEYSGSTFAPTVMPTGYEIESVEDSDSIYIVVYTNGENEIYFTQMSNSTSGKLRVNTENAQRVETIMIGDSEALLVVIEEDIGVRSQIVWSIGNHLLHLKSYENNPDELVVIAQSIKLMK